MAKYRKKDQGTSLPPGDGAPQFAGDTTVGNSDRDRIAMRAYELYLARGGVDGAAMDDWLNAERELGNPPRDWNQES